MCIRDSLSFDQYIDSDSGIIVTKRKTRNHSFTYGSFNSIVAAIPRKRKFRKETKIEVSDLTAKKSGFAQQKNTSFSSNCLKKLQNLILNQSSYQKASENCSIEPSAFFQKLVPLCTSLQIEENSSDQSIDASPIKDLNLRLVLSDSLHTIEDPDNDLDEKCNTINDVLPTPLRQEKSIFKRSSLN
eukprot:TRINITY_DN9093_c0_g1_i1.p1 TRINITY_DN9093_c0_g1~~TRINITY_DN9093_c0_g1_i1.p1  ORF type:complete len:186 (+),score=16.94 TRINITY_DN9093_c0_g1_i1:61-618(+)